MANKGKPTLKDKILVGLLYACLVTLAILTGNKPSHNHAHSDEIARDTIYIYVEK